MASLHFSFYLCSFRSQKREQRIYKHYPRLKQDEKMLDENDSLTDIDDDIKQVIKKNEEEVLRTIQLQSIGQIEDVVQNCSFTIIVIER